MRATLFALVVLVICLILGPLHYQYYLTAERHWPVLKQSRLVLIGQKQAAPLVANRSRYTIVFVGDSMTELLGNFTETQDYLHLYYPDKHFLLLNYGFGSTNILSTQERFIKPTVYGRVFKPIVEINFDVLVIESFGYNPLSEYALAEGLEKQEQILDNLIGITRLTHQQAKIVFLATIAPNRDHFGQGKVALTKQVRKQWANERAAYIENHLLYAKTHNIPIIDVYHKSRDIFGSGNLNYISRTDNMHPSPKGIYLINEQIATFFYRERFF